MFDLIARYVAEKYMQFKDGEIWFGKERVVFYFVPHLNREFSINYGVYGLDYCSNLFIAGRRQGNTFVKQHGIPLMKSLTQVVKISCEILNMFGFGIIKTIKVDDKNGFMILAGKSALAEDMKSRGGSKIPVDFMLAGLFAGAAEYYTKKQMYAVEITCAAQTNVQECTWAIGSKESIFRYVKQFSPDRLDWAKSVIDNIKMVEVKLKTTVKANEPYDGYT